MRRTELLLRLAAKGHLPPSLASKRAALEELIRFHARTFGGSLDQEVFAAFVPGRIEVLGKHTDYAGGHSILAALDRGFLVVASANTNGRVRVAEDHAEFPPLDVRLASDLAPGVEGWGNYVTTAARRLAANFGRHELAGMDCVISSDLAVGSGMSGSSALIILISAALAEVNGLGRHPAFREHIRDGLDLAMYLACVENGQSFRGLEGGRGVGTFGGSEDHTAILNAREGALSRYTFSPTGWVADTPWPSGWGLSVCFSGVRAEKTREAKERYNLLSRRAAAVVEVYNRATGSRVLTLREVADATDPAGLRALATSPDHPTDPWDLPGRLEQFRREDRGHLPAAWSALVRRDGPAFGEAVTASHESSRRYLDNIAPEIDDLARLAREEGAWGASGFGAGFGGSAYAVHPAEAGPRFLDRWRDDYAALHPGRMGEAWFCSPRPAAGLTVLSADAPARWVDLLFSAR